MNSSNDHISAIASRDAKRITIVVANHQYDKLYSEGLSYPLNIDVKTDWKPGNNVILKHWRIDKNHSNSYTAFKELGSYLR